MINEKTIFMIKFSKGGTQHKASTAELTINSVNKNETILNTLHIKIAMDMAIVNAVSTGHFLIPVTQVNFLKPSDKPLTINLPDGTQLQSTHTCEINVPWLPKAARI